MAACCHGNCSSDLWTRFASVTSMQMMSKFIQSNGATPDFHGQGRMQSRFSPSEFDIRRWWSLESGKNSLIIAGGKRMKNILQQKYKKKIWGLDFGVTWHSQIYFQPLPMEGFIVPKEVFCFPLALSRGHIHAFTVRIWDGGDWSQSIYRRIMDKTSLCCCLQDGSGRDEGAGNKSSGCLPVASSWRGRGCLME